MEPGEYLRMHAAEEQHWWYIGLHDLVIRWLQRERTDQQRPLNILDAGCGTGRLCQLMQPFGNVTGCDLHPLAVAATAARGIAQVFQGDLMTASLGVAAFDVITCMDVLYHRAVTDDAAALQNLYRALRPGGLLLLDVAAFEFLRGAHDVVVHTCRRYRRPALTQLLQATGLRLEFSSYRLSCGLLPMLLLRLRSRHAPTQGGDDSDIAHACPAVLNRGLTAMLRLENSLLLAGWRMPFGTSLFAAARKREPTGFLATCLKTHAQMNP
jgi:SAM-dependent methyltransferase